MITFRQLMEKLEDDTRIEDEGLYSAVKPDDTTRAELEKFTNTHFGIHLPEDVHATVIYSTKAIPPELATEYSKLSYAAIVKGFDYWDGHDNDGYLVAKLESDDLHKEHSRLVGHGCKPTFENYTPHVTIANPIDKESGKKFADIGNANIGKGIKLVLQDQHIDTLKK